MLKVVSAGPADTISRFASGSSAFAYFDLKDLECLFPDA